MTWTRTPADPVAPAAARTPRAVRALRLLLFVVAVITVLVLIGGLLAAGGDSYYAGRLVFAALPGLLSLVLAVLLPRRGRVLWWAVIALQAVTILFALSVIGHGELRGLANLVLPVVVLVLTFRRSTRDWFRHT